MSKSKHPIKLDVSENENGAILSDGDVYNVLPGGMITDTILNKNGTVNLQSGAAANRTTINSGGGLNVFSGATAKKTTVKRGGYFGVGDGAEVDDTTIDYAGQLTVWGGGFATRNTINEYGAIILSSGAAANSSIINARGELHVYSGAVASNTLVKQSGGFGVGDGATTYNTTIDYAGELKVWGGGVVINNTINEYGAIILLEGALAKDSIINAYGGLHVYSGAVASDTVVKQNGGFGVGDGATTYNTTIDYAGELKVWGGGIVINNTINEYGAIILLNGAFASNTQIEANGALHIYEGAVARDVEVEEGANLGVGGGGTVIDAKVHHKAGIIFYEGSAVGGTVDISGTMTINGFLNTQDSRFIFNISDKDTTDCSNIMLNSVAALGSSNLFIRVESGFQQKGYYAIAGGATGFDRSITIINENNETLGAVSQLVPSCSANGITYSLLSQNDTLYLVVSYEDSTANVRLHLNGSVVNSGTTLNNQTLGQGHFLVAEQNGSTENVQINANATLLTSNGGTARNVNIADGYANAFDGFIENLTVKNGYATVTGDGIIRNTTLSGGALIAKDNGIAYNVNQLAGTVEATNGGTVIGVQVSSGGYMHASSGGRIQDGTVSNGGLAQAEVGGVLKNTTVLSGGIMAVHTGAEAKGIKLRTDANLYISNGARVTGLEYIDRSAKMQIGITKDTFVQYVSNGVSHEIRNGKMSGAAIAGLTYLEVSSGAVISDLTIRGYAGVPGVERGGALELFAGASASNVMNHDYGQVNVFSGGYLSGASTDTEAEIYLYGGEASDITVNSKGYLWIHSGSYVKDIDITKGGGVVVSSGAKVADVHISSGGHIIVEEPNAYISNAVISNGGIVEVAGGSACFTEVLSGGVLTFSNSFWVMDGPLVESPNGQAYDVIVRNGGNLTARYTGSATRVKADSGAIVHVMDGSEIRDLIAENGAQVIISSGGKLIGADIACAVSIENGACTKGLTVQSGGFATIRGTADYLTLVDAGANIFGTVNDISTNADIMIGSGGIVEVLNLTEDAGVTIAYGGTVEELMMSSGFATIAGNVGSFVTGTGGTEVQGNVTTLKTSGSITVAAGAAVGSLEMDGSGFATIAGNVGSFKLNANGANITGSVSNLQQNTGGISLSGTVNGAQIHGYDYVFTLNSGALLTGNVSIDSTARIFANAGARINLDITGKSAGDAAVFQGLDRVSGLDFTWSVSLNSSQKSGIYKLATGSVPADTLKSLALYVDNVFCGNLSENSTSYHNGVGYTYDMDSDGNLSLELNSGSYLSAAAALEDDDQKSCVLDGLLAL